MTIRQVLAVRDTDAAEPDPEAAMARVASARVASARPAMEAAQARPDGAVSGPELPVRVPASGVPTAKPMAPRRRWWHRSTVIGAAVAVMVLGSTPSSSSTSTAAAVVPRKPSPAEIAVVAAETADGPVHGEFPVVSVDGSRLTRRWQWGEVVAIDQVPACDRVVRSGRAGHRVRTVRRDRTGRGDGVARSSRVAGRAAVVTAQGAVVAEGGGEAFCMITVASEDGYASDYWVDAPRAAGLALGEWVTVVGELPAA